MTGQNVAIVGAGMGGLAAAIDLAALGFDVKVIERASSVGGKARQVSVNGVMIDAGPTVFTMRWIFDALFSDAGASFSDCVDLEPATILARHAWRDGGQLDLYADRGQSVDAIAEFAGSREAQGYGEFCERSAEIFKTLNSTFIEDQKPSPVMLAKRVGFGQIGALLRTRPFDTLWSSLAGYFSDPRLQQLFGRYATYCGCSPFQAPATLMLVAHVEQDGVWTIDGGMHALANAMRDLAEAKGVLFQMDCDVDEILVDRGRASGVRMADGTQIECDYVIFNGDVQALSGGLLGSALTGIAPSYEPAERSLSAITWCVKGKTSGFPLEYHNVFFAKDYAAEFKAIFKDRTITNMPTVYVCAQDRKNGYAGEANERLLILINAPADGDKTEFSKDCLSELLGRVLSLLSECGLSISFDERELVVTTPSDFNRLFPATGGALYGRANHGAFASFSRPSAQTSIDGLYLAGGSVHPGPGVPMAVMSGRLAAAKLAEDWPQNV